MTDHDTVVSRDPEYDSPTTRQKMRRKTIAADTLQKYALLGTWAVMIGIFSLLLPRTFPTWANITVSILGSQSVLVLLAFSVVLTLTAGDFDLSCGANLGLSAMAVAVLNVHHGVPIGLAVLIAVLIGATIGTVNGFLVLRARVDSLITTLATGTIIGGVTLWASNSETISGVSPILSQLVVVPRVAGLPFSFFYAIAVTFLIWYLLKYTPVGRRLLFVGRGRRVSRLSGLRVDRLRWGAFIGGGVLAALAGVVYVGTSASADPSSGQSLLLPAFAAAFLGSTAIAPGRFNAWGTLAAVYFLGTGVNGLSLLGLQVYIHNLFYGGALIIAVALSIFLRRGDVPEDDTIGAD